MKVNDLINSFDWLSVKKNEAYPVFTDASTNDPLPWPDQLADKKVGPDQRLLPLEERA